MIQRKLGGFRSYHTGTEPAKVDLDQRSAMVSAMMLRLWSGAKIHQTKIKKHTIMKIKATILMLAATALLLGCKPPADSGGTSGGGTTTPPAPTAPATPTPPAPATNAPTPQP